MPTPPGPEGSNGNGLLRVQWVSGAWLKNQAFDSRAPGLARLKIFQASPKSGCLTQLRLLRTTAEFVPACCIGDSLSPAYNNDFTSVLESLRFEHTCAREDYCPRNLRPASAPDKCRPG